MFTVTSTQIDYECDDEEDCGRWSRSLGLDRGWHRARGHGLKKNIQFFKKCW